jgi:ABC-type dipeptide/oligopeptide/nickel transport system permease component
LPYNVDGIIQIDAYALMLLLLIGAAVMLAASLLGEVAVALLDPRMRSD